MMKLFMLLVFTLSITGCGGGGGNNNNDNSTNTSGNASGVITLSGDDTSIVGTQLDTGYVGSSLAAEFQPDYITIVDKASSVTFTPPNVLIPNIADPSNGFVMVIMDDSPGSGIKGISMSIIVGGTKLDYACTTPVATYIECGINSIDLDIANKTVIFDNATVTNTDTGTILTIDGTLTWSGSNNSGNGNSGGNGNAGGALTDITGTWKDDDPATWTSTLGYADEVYVIYKQDGTYLGFDYYTSIACYDAFLGAYEDLGNGNISLDGDPPYQFSITGNVMTVSYLGDSYTATKSTLIESDFAPICN